MGQNNRMFDGFEKATSKADGCDIFYLKGGSGPPLLLLHGYPQTHVCWHLVAPELAKEFTVVVPDLRGYGASGKPPTDDQHTPYSKRVMAADMAALMVGLGYDRFAVVGHDRGGRVAHRLAADRPDRVTKIAVLDIAPTQHMYGNCDQEFATGYYHWFFLIQPFDLPERLIGADPGYYLRQKMGQWSADGAVFDEAAMEAYVKAFSDPACIHASCEDYRAAATIDLAHDADDMHIGAKLQMPLLALWGSQGLVARKFDVLSAWAERAEHVSGGTVDGGHFLPEEAAEQTIGHLKAFFL